MSRHRTVIVRHWFPILTFCPVNGLPDLIYASVTFEDNLDHELYAIRRRIRKLLSGRKRFMEDLADDLAREFPEATTVSIRLAFDRHVVHVDNL